MTDRTPLVTSALAAHCSRCRSAVARIASPSVAVGAFALRVLVEHHTEQPVLRGRCVGALLMVAALLGYAVWIAR